MNHGIQMDGGSLHMNAVAFGAHSQVRVETERTAAPEHAAPRRIDPGTSDNRTILVIDMQGSSDPLRLTQQTELRSDLYECVRKACESAGIPWQDCYREDRGDGFMLLVPAAVPKTRLSSGFPHDLALSLRAHNSRHLPAATLRLRVALHAGEVRHDEQGVTGAALTLTFRLNEAEPVRDALRDGPSPLALAVSSWFYDEVIRQDPTAEEDNYQQIPFEVKEIATTAWLRLP